MDKILVLLHTEPDGTLGRAAMESLGVAASLGAYEIAISGAGSAAAAGKVGAALCVQGDEFAVPRSSTDAAAAEALIRASAATLVLAPGTSRWSRALPMAAARLNGVIDTHIVGLETGPETAGDSIQLKRWFYRQRIEGTVARTRRPWIVLIEPGAFPAVDGPVARTPVETRVVVVEATPRTTVLGTVSESAGEQTIRPDAELLFVAGAGWTKKQKDGQVHIADAAERIQSFVHKAKCSLGSSKSLVDQAGEGEAILPFLTHLHQVGQTGSTPRHKKGLATCCHGEEPHVVGWRFINERRAVNLDASCGWARGKADVLYVADAFEVMRELNALLD